MSIKDVAKINARQMETLKRKQNREIAQIEDGHKKLKSEIKATNDLELVELQHENVKKVGEESSKKEKVLTQMKAHLDATKNLTDREIKELKDYSASFKKNEQLKLTAEREKVQQENQLYLDDLNYRFDSEQRKVQTEGRDQVEGLKVQKGREYTQTKEQFQSKINQQNTQFNEKYQADGRKQQQLKDNLDQQFKKERLSTNFRQQKDIAKLTEAHNSQLEVRDNKFRHGLKDQDLMFEKKYAETLKKRNVEFSRLEELNNKVLTQMKEDLAVNLKTRINRSDDPFYSFTELNPKLKEYDDRVEITVAVPEYAKTDMQLTIHGKEAIINFNRRYDDARKVEGVTNKLHKVESFTTRLLTSHHLDPKSVKSSYEDGVMLYTIKRT